MEPTPLQSQLTKNLSLKVGLLLVSIGVLTTGFFLYVLFTRGVFDKSRRLILLTRNAEGITVGTPLLFSGLAIGKVSSVSLAKDGDAQIEFTIPLQNEHWLREGSIFVVERPIVGAVKIKAHTIHYDKPVLPDGSKHPLLSRDASAEIPEIIERTKDLLVKIDNLFDDNSSLNKGFSNLRVLTEKLIGEYGILEGLLGSQEKAKAFGDLADRAGEVFIALSKLSEKGESLIEKSDERLFGPEGILTKVRDSLSEAHELLKETREVLRKTEAVLLDAKAIGSNLKEATLDIDELRKDVERNLEKVEILIDDISISWPFRPPAEIYLP